MTVDDAAAERSARERVRRLLAPIVDEFIDPPRGGGNEDIAAVCRSLGLQGLPPAVDAYLRLVGADTGLCGSMFAGEDTFDVATLLDVGNRSLEAAREFGAPAELLEIAVPYTATAEHVAWLGGDRPPTDEDRIDPMIWAITEDGELYRVGRFTDDLAIRVGWGIDELSRIRHLVDAGFFHPGEQAAIEMLGRDAYDAARRVAEEQLAGSFDEDAAHRLERTAAANRQRHAELRRRLRG